LLPTAWGNSEKGPRDVLYVPTLWGGGGRLGARPEGVPRAGEPQEKEICAGPPAALGYVDGSGGGGSVNGPRDRSPLNNNNNNNNNDDVDDDDNNDDDVDLPHSPWSHLTRRSRGVEAWEYGMGRFVGRLPLKRL
jgi:hypothetical protein